MESYQPEVHLSDYLRILKSRKSILFTFFFITVLTVTVGTFLMEPVYRSTVTLMIDLESPNVLTTTGAVVLGRADYYAYKEYFQSQKEIIKSRSIVRQVFKESKTSQLKDFLKAKNPIGAFIKTTKVEPVRDTRLLLLHVDNKDPKVAAQFANRIADIYVARNLFYITKSEVMNLLKNEYLKLQTRLSEKSKIFKSKHPKILRLKEEIKQMVGRIKEEKERSGGGYDFAKFSSSGLKFKTSSSILSGLKANNITIQDRAEISRIPIKPKKRLNILLGIIVGLFGGVGLVFFFEYLDNTVKTSEEVESVFKWPVLGTVPKIRGKGKRTEIQRDLFTHTSPKDPIAEFYRSIRTSVLFSSTEEHPVKSIVVTSPGPKEGKTTTLCNLAIAMAQSGKQVLLVDADMRKSRLHQVFKVKSNTGLSNFLSGQANFADLIQETEINNLFLVSGGHHPPNPSELLTSRKMKDFIDIAKMRFDFILFDTPPLALVTDTAVLSKVTDGAILVFESGRTNKRILPRINKILKEAQVRIIGVVLNKISPGHSDYHYYSYYYGKTN